jgi:hypothetical protein
MTLDYLQRLDAAVAILISQESYANTIEAMKVKLAHCAEAFVWSVIDLKTFPCDLPDKIKSAWIFVLKRDVSSGCHYHPNSIQHMVMIEGQGQSRVGESQKRMVRFGSPGVSLNDQWYVIGESVPHEFLPEDSDMVVVSFHTCAATELEEIACGTGERRLYERESD